MDMVVIEKEALRLPDSQRALLVDRLIESLSSSVVTNRTVWLEELDSRMEAYRKGEVEVLDGEQAVRGIRDRLVR